MKKIIWSLMLGLSLHISVGAQTALKTDDKQEAIAVANKLFEAMRAKNAEAIRALFMPEGQLVAIDKAAHRRRCFEDTRLYRRRF